MLDFLTGGLTAQAGMLGYRVVTTVLSMPPAGPQSMLLKEAISRKNIGVLACVSRSMPSVLDSLWKELAYAGAQQDYMSSSHKRQGGRGRPDYCRLNRGLSC